MATKEKNLQYEADQIRTAEGREHVRMRPSMYIGSTANPNHLAIEIMANSIDEAMNGHGDQIVFSISPDRKQMLITDFGRGIPVATKREDGLTTLEASFSVLNTSGKFDQNAFQTSIGTNGIGGKATNFLSEYFEVKSVRDGKFETLIFKRGELQSREVGSTDEKSGVSVLFRPDTEIFSTVEFNIELLKETLKQSSYLNKGIKFSLHDEKDASTVDFISENGLGDYIKELSKDSPLITKNPLYVNHQIEGASLEVALGYNASYSEVVKSFANTGYTPENGTHLTAVRTCLTRQLNNYANDNGIFKAGEKNLTGKDYGDGLVLVLNVNMPDMGYDGQTKTKVTDTRCASFINPIMNESVTDWLNSNPQDARAIINKALESRRANEAAKKAREKVLKPKKDGSLKKRLQLTSKLTDSSSKIRKDCELLIVEGK